MTRPLIVYRAGDDWFGQEVEWKRSGSGTYREVKGVGIPQTVAEIEAFAAANGYIIQWRDPAPAPIVASEPAAMPKGVA